MAQRAIQGLSTNHVKVGNNATALMSFEAFDFTSTSKYQLPIAYNDIPA